MCLHALTEYRAVQLGRKSFRNYLVLGDDVAVFDKAVYKQLLKNLRLLGVETNPQKSTQSNYRAEMAKQFFWKGNNVTGFPLDLVSEVRKSPMQALELLRNIVNLGYKPIPAPRVLKLVPKRYRAKVAKILPVPHPFGYPEALAHCALERGNIESKWVWQEEKIIKAYKYAIYERFFKEVQRLKINLEELKAAGLQSSNTQSSDSLFEDHPLIIGLGSLVMKSLRILESLELDSDQSFAREEQILRLAFPPVSEVYTHGSLKHKRAHFRGHVLLDALSKLENDDLSLDDRLRDLGPFL